MKYFIPFAFLLLITGNSFCQNSRNENKESNAGKMYFFWGWHRAWFSHSDITFIGEGHNFTLKNVKAVDKQEPFSIDPYFHPTKLTVPQTNFRIGYYINNKYNISFGFDHMKYVVVGNQYVKISGEINNTETSFDGVYSNTLIPLTPNFLKFEHTNGLNYVNTELRRIESLTGYRKFKLNFTEGLGAGVVIPKTNSSLINYGRNDEFHLAGYGFNAIAGLNITYHNLVFIQSELKGGFINMPDIKSTANDADKAKQHFFYTQANIVFGAIINFQSRKSKDHKKS